MRVKNEFIPAKGRRQGTQAVHVSGPLNCSCPVVVSVVAMLGSLMAGAEACPFPGIR